MNSDQEKVRIIAAFGRLFTDPNPETLEADAAIVFERIMQEGGVFMVPKATPTHGDAFAHGVAEGKRQLALFIMSATNIARERYPALKERAYAATRGVQDVSE